jgi:phosphoglycerate dehydrogenase-like enzyme
VERIYISYRKNKIEMSKTKIVNFCPMPAEVFILQLSRRTDVSNVEVVSLPQRLTEEEACQAVKDATIITTYPLAPRVTRKMLEAAEKLKLVQCTSVGYDHIDLKAAAELNCGCRTHSHADVDGAQECPIHIHENCSECLGARRISQILE